MMKAKSIFVKIISLLTVIFVTGTVVSAQNVDTSGGGSATITIENASQGKDYTLYKLFDATVGENGEVAYTVPSGKTLGENDYFSVNSQGNVSAKENIDVSSEAFKTWAASFGSQVATATAENNKIVFTGLTYGYYYVQSSLGGTITVDSTTPNATLKDKNETKPIIPDDMDGGGKTIIVNGQTVTESSVKIGETVTYQIKFEATNHVTEGTGDNVTSKLITQYTVVDTPTNVVIDKDSVAVTVAGTTINNPNKSFDADGVMTLTLPWADNDTSIYASPSEVVITYNATVTKDAQDGKANNKASIKYTTEDGENPIDPDEPEYPTLITTHSFTLNKTDENGKALTGATFRLYDAQTGGNEIKVVKVSDGVYRVAEDGEAGVDIEAGTAVVKGLKADTTYYLEETKAPNGYNILTERKAVTVTKDDAAKVTVENHSGAELPSTGSYGTTIFYV
ncbi:SpaA isopeptide-forming pilin-related protein, partial [Streptococcus alactolyticus]|uniref:SpaA isopeptide-forming pilin-related protein n=1 Tax=Streptococcus alactolyticus TaxID=29389 RepID=UPI003CFFDB2A